MPGAPIRDRFGQVVAGLSVSFPCFRFREDLKAEYVEQMLATTARISAQMGAPAR